MHLNFGVLFVKWQTIKIQLSYEIIINRLFSSANANLGHTMPLENEKFKKKRANKDKLIENDVIG